MSFTDEEIARIAHEANRALQGVMAGVSGWGSSWSSLDQATQDSEVELVKAARYGASPEVIHEKRMEDDPDLVPFDQLPPGDRAKDYLFAGVCAAMNKAADVKMKAENDQAALVAAADRVANIPAAQLLGRSVIPAQSAPQPPERADG